MTDVTKPVSQGSETKRLLREFWFYFSENRGAVIGLCVFLALVLIAAFAPLLAPHSPTLQNRDALLVPPFWEQGGNPSFLLGTDAVGRDILSRLIFGARQSLFIGCVVVSIALTGGIIPRPRCGLLRRMGGCGHHAGDGCDPGLPVAAPSRS